MAGIKESKELAVFLSKAGVVAKEQLADGFQPTDLIAFASKCGGALLVAVNGAGEIPAELKDIDMAEGLEVVKAVVVELALSEKQAKIVEKVLVILVAGLDLYQTIKE